MNQVSRDQQPATRPDNPGIGRRLAGARQTMKITTLALITTATVAATIAVAACSTSTNGAGQSTSAVGKPAPTSSSAPAAGQGSSCEVNPSSAPVPAAEPYAPVPEVARISVTLSGVASGTVKPGAAPTEVDVTLCNNSAVAYPKVGVVLALQRCTCAAGLGITRGTVERFDPATGTWIQLESPAMGTGMDYLGAYTNEQALPKGKAVTLRYRIALDAAMTDGKGGLQAVAVTPEPLNQIGKADLPFTVSTEPTTPSNGPTPQQTTLKITGLYYASAVAVDTAGNVYVADTNNNRVLKLGAGSNAQTVLPFTGLHYPSGVAVDGSGNVYVTDDTKVVKLAAGSNAQTVLPFTGLHYPGRVAVDTAGNVYVTDKENHRVVKLAAGSNTQTVLPFTGLKSPGDVAVDTAGNVYVADSHNNRVLKLAAGSNTQTELPLTGLDNPERVAVDNAGDLYVIDNSNKQVVKQAAGSGTQTVLGFTGLNFPQSVAVDNAGNVYVLDESGFGQVVKLAAG